MKKLLITLPCFVLLYLNVESFQPSHSRHKRTIFQLCGLINYYTGISCWNYNDYGCFCGLGNSGHKPVDNSDACCRKHDNCYGRLNCYWYYPQWIGYEIDCNNSTCACQDDPVDYACARSVCECDLRLAQCLRDASPTYNEHYKNYDRVLCRPRRRRK
ncbi:hypothetical protein LOTGIDRAFT_222658 [Lottia gigantea]|uniref:Phospholipase A2 n=1 Tax=Lottia gigantea TaxID=225164 RepID=V4B4S7_LOTGI|nr:hypothetical protein LOTGIDRAFT_222658 [Lottia gigantea]ESO83429.1 hypothetical protein LOTGIDRAFT_222658 [Lottia gigantea]